MICSATQLIVIDDCAPSFFGQYSCIFDNSRLVHISYIYKYSHIYRYCTGNHGYSAHNLASHNYAEF